MKICQNNKLIGHYLDNQSRGDRKLTNLICQVKGKKNNILHYTINLLSHRLSNQLNRDKVIMKTCIDLKKVIKVKVEDHKIKETIIGTLVMLLINSCLKKCFQIKDTTFLITNQTILWTRSNNKNHPLSQNHTKEQV